MASLTECVSSDQSYSRLQDYVLNSYAEAICGTCSSLTGFHKLALLLHKAHAICLALSAKILVIGYLDFITSSAENTADATIIRFIISSATVRMSPSAIVCGFLHNSQLLWEEAGATKGSTDHSLGTTGLNRSWIGEIIHG